MPDNVMAAIAADWHDALGEFPAWAISAACRWWMGAGNIDRRRKPMPGDIEARCNEEMWLVNAAQRRVDGYGRPQPVLRAVEPREEIAPERRAEMATEIASIADTLRSKCSAERGFK